MRKITDHIKYVKGKPHHIRKKVAFGMAGGVTGLVALLWLGVSLSTGAFAIQGSNFAESTGQADGLTTSNPTGNAVAGAAAALETDKSTPRIEIVNVATATPRQQPEQTTIPF